MAQMPDDNVIQFVPRPNPDRERKLAEEAAKILAEAVPYGGQGIDGMTFPDNDPA